MYKVCIETKQILCFQWKSTCIFVLMSRKYINGNIIHCIGCFILFLNLFTLFINKYRPKILNYTPKWTTPDTLANSSRWPQPIFGWQVVEIRRQSDSWTPLRFLTFQGQTENGQETSLWICPNRMLDMIWARSLSGIVG